MLKIKSECWCMEKDFYMFNKKNLSKKKNLLVQVSTSKNVNSSRIHMKVAMPINFYNKNENENHISEVVKNWGEEWYPKF